MSGTITSGKEFAKRLTARLNGIEAAGGSLAMWWRDDDAVAATPALDRLLALTNAHSVPLGLAVIPQPLEPSLAPILEGTPALRVLLHGWAHKNHQPTGEKAAELGDGRTVEQVCAELADGRDLLETAFGERFLPVLVPPWNRIAPAVAVNLGGIGLAGLSTFGRAPKGGKGLVNTHLDLIAWRTTRGFIGWQSAWNKLERKIAARLETGSSEPIGLLSHHLVHDRGCWEFLETVLRVTTSSPAVRWPDLEELFGIRS